ncbi:hypothetical protein [Rhodococcus sp. NPDC058514]|uniref:hypothetical protein n=1 Tax=Rhodococcus sp. NPDC058514 TaxID=3346532 RepID=UPI003653E070
MGRRGGGVGVDVVVIGTVIALGVVVAGLLNDGGGEYSAQIPGCDVVKPPAESRRINIGWAGYPSYDNPRYQWFSGPKATAMTAALADALPGDAEVEFAPLSQSLLFQPILDLSDAVVEPEGVNAEDFGGSTSAQGVLTSGEESGSLMIDVRQARSTVPPPCVAGELDRRSTLPDGTVIDIRERANGLARSVMAYLPDGTGMWVRAKAEESGPSPLTIEELTAIVTTPGLRVTTPVPAGTPSPPEPCSAKEDEPATYEFDRATVDRLNRVLDDQWQRRPDGPATLDRPLGSLWLSDLDAGRSGVCEVLTVTTPEAESRLRVSITAEAPPRMEQPEDPDGPRRSTSTLPDGTVVERVEASPAAVTETIRSVTVTKPSGVQIQVSSSAQAPAAPLRLDELESIATAPGLEL